MDACERRIALLTVMSERRFETTMHLANEFGVSRNTIARDVLTLSCSYPLFTTRGNGGGIHMVEGYIFGNNYLSEEQYALLERLSHDLTGTELDVMHRILKTFRKPGLIKRN